MIMAARTATRGDPAHLLRGVEPRMQQPDREDIAAGVDELAPSRYRNTQTRTVGRRGNRRHLRTAQPRAVPGDHTPDEARQPSHSSGGDRNANHCAAPLTPGAPAEGQQPARSQHRCRHWRRLRASSLKRRRRWPVAVLINCSGPMGPGPPEKPPSGPSKSQLCA
jgi:hypothetical protein